MTMPMCPTCLDYSKRLYFTSETLQALYPYALKAADEDFEGGTVGIELRNFANNIRSELQHRGIVVEDLANNGSSEAVK